MQELSSFVVLGGLQSFRGVPGPGQGAGTAGKLVWGLEFRIRDTLIRTSPRSGGNPRHWLVARFGAVNLWGEGRSRWLVHLRSVDPISEI